MLPKTFSNGSGRAQVGAHGHDDGALLGGQMLVDFRHGGTLQQKVLHLVFENAVPKDMKPRKKAKKLSYD
jgi:hypothetical protein